jgi:hypothetical protein
MQPPNALKSLAAKKRAALNIFSAPPFRRNIPLPKVREKLLRTLKKELLADKFKSMPCIGIDTEVRIFEHNGTKVVVKDTGGDKFSGYARNIHKHPAHNFLKAHHAHYREKKLRTSVEYMLRTPKLFGRIGNFLVMEYIPRWSPKSAEEQELLSRASRQMDDVAQNVAAERWVHKLQTQHFIPAGIHNGKVIFYAVYDYV